MPTEDAHTPEPPTIDLTLDVTDLPCPLPVLKTKKALGTLPGGAVLEVLASDPASLADMRALCLATGHHLLSSETAETEGKLTHRFLIKKAVPHGALG